MLTTPVSGLNASRALDAAVLSGDVEFDVLRIIASHCNDSIVVTRAEPLEGPDGPEVVYVNEAFERMTGYSAAEAVGETPRILQCADTDQTELTRLSKALHAWEEVRVTLLNQRKDGERFWVEMDIVPVADGTGWYHYWIAIQRDVTDRVEREQRLEAEKRAAVAESASKSQHLANTSHELRTPLNAILGFTDFLKSSLPGELNPAQRECLDNIEMAGGHLLEMVSDILDMTKVDQGVLALDVEPAPIMEIIDPVLIMLRGAAHVAGVELRLAGDMEGHVTCDKARVRQVLINIVGNAIKYAPGKPVILSVDRSDDRVTFTARDHGRGLTAEEIAVITRPFGRLDPGVEGVGLGLPISISLMRLHGGDLEITSAPGEGTTVTMWLPLRETAA